MSEGPQKRRFERLELDEGVLAIDEQGRMLGRVTVAGGGGFQIEQVPPTIFSGLKIGQRIRLTLHEASTTPPNTALVEVRWLQGNTVGLEFVTKVTS